MTGKAADVMSPKDIAKRDAARGFTDADLADVMDNPEWTDEELRNSRPFAEVFPDLATSVARGRSSRKA